ncbi:polyprenyl synthetase family protein [Pseudonocardia sp. Ae505_Ps2]|uniref:polyprenyl synthetase family protein n=1 Tax=Pseudonocardia sp. Ae505_Ps2 TaxID=1885034 RepID=UPI000ADC2479|nr:polyprenyl synthetase family protein [Pseudonocardia sp. Ae505_Ps2]
MPVATCAADRSRSPSSSRPDPADREAHWTTTSRWPLSRPEPCSGGACRAGAALGGGDAGQVDLLGDYGHHTGVAFQLFDDLLPYLDDAVVTGKPATSDAANLRPTWPVLLAHRDGGPAVRRAVETALSGDLGPSEAHEMLRAAVTADDLWDAARCGARGHADRAVARLGELPGAEAARRLAGIAAIAVDRDR